MAFQKIGASDSTAERKPFLEDFLEELSRKEQKTMANSMHQVSLISFGRKGIILSTELFSVFLWKGSDIYSMIADAADVWANGEPAKSLQVFIDDPSTANYVLGVDDTSMVQWDSYKKGKKLKISTDEDDTDSTMSNPFL